MDLVVIGLKTTANADLEELLPPLLHDGTLLLTLQNGLGNEEFLAQHWGAERVLGGLCFVCLNRVAPGVSEHYGHGTLSLGEFGRAPMERTRRHPGALFSTHPGAWRRRSWKMPRHRGAGASSSWNIPFNGLSIATGEPAPATCCSPTPACARKSARLLSWQGDDRFAAGRPRASHSRELHRFPNRGAPIPWAPLQALEHDRLAGGPQHRRSGIDLG